MKLNLVLVASVLSVLAQANPIDAPVAAPELLSEALDKRADKSCKVTVNDVNCRLGAGTGYKVKYVIDKSLTFGVRCKAYGESISGNR